MSLCITQTHDIAACHALRRRVFIEEQGVSADDERDNLDDQALHILAQQDGTPVGCARIIIQGETAKIGRVCVLAHLRGAGLGAQIMRVVVDLCRKETGLRHIRLSAQISACGFYEKLGFETIGNIYSKAGIQHQDMVLPL